jgi:hypothetical protein
MEFGGIIPTSVTTAVILLGGVRSYKGLRISKFVSDCKASVSLLRFEGKVERNVPIGAMEIACQIDAVVYIHEHT